MWEIFVALRDGQRYDPPPKRRGWLLVLLGLAGTALALVVGVGLARWW